MRRVIISFSICVILGVLTSVGIALYRHANLEEFGNIFMYVSLGMTVLGGLFIWGATMSGDSHCEIVAEAMSHDPDEYRRARREDQARGMGFGWIVFLAGASSAAVCYSYLINN